MKYSDSLIEEIIVALNNANYEVRYYFNKETREVDYSVEYIIEEQDNEEGRIDFSDWIEIEGIKSYEKYNLMQDFTARQNDRLREILDVALNGKGTFRRFKDVLYRYPEEEKNWYEFEHNWLKQRAIEFLDKVYS
ncbi:MAG: UPF0158 family protein [Candidatus Cloacimonetes bacterium]|nr:UPF0158 family protein [Candidatus Cloacimonadota bacterium]MCF7813025.1 UPF0158 family protein [Candidatus Cloacimonadota bacterium]MCF7867234.1 UPF0158 family protein [Candidatus Cloacimonadota bacterium]MCF7882678.1 UPF0158 family protein [Candidatus Cloacimonadota bacterium]